MRTALLLRAETGPQGTFGRLLLPGISFFTGELPWRENRSDLSCIPLGVYRCPWTMSPRFRRRMYLVEPVPGRAGIRVHSANFMGDNPPFHKQLNGCIALGEKLGWMDGQKAVLLSAPAIRRFESIMKGETFILEVRAWPTP